MKKVLIAYTTNAGSTEEVARAVAAELGKNGDPVDIRRLEEVSDIASYDAVVVGAPLILGWRRSALSFIKKHQAALAQVKVAYFITGMSLTELASAEPGKFPVFIDPEMPKPPKSSQRMSFKERYATVANYLAPLQKAAPQVKPVSVAFFGGKLEMFRLNFLQMLFVMVVIQAQPGDHRNWDAIKQWAGDLRTTLLA